MGDETVQTSNQDLLESLKADMQVLERVITDYANDEDRKKALYPFPGGTSWGVGNVWVPKHKEIANIPKEALSVSDQPVIMDFKSVMQTLQKTIAIDHAKKVREGKESVNMNGILRAKYSEDNYYFPDRILNSGLSKKDFTAPFLIDVKLINQDCGKAKENEKKRVANTKPDRDISSPEKDESRKRKEPIIANNEAEALVCSPTLFAMLEKSSGSKRLRVSDSGRSAAPVFKPTVTIYQDTSMRKTQPSILAKNLTSPTGRATRSSLTAVTASQQVLRNGNGVVNSAGLGLNRSLPVKPPVPIQPKPDSAQYVSISQKLPITVITPEKKNHNPPQAKVAQNEKEQQDDDFSPKIVNTQGSVVMAKSIQESASQANGVPPTLVKHSPPAPQLLKTQPRKTYENLAKTQPANATPTPKTTSVRGSGFFGCKTCGKTFPSNCDNFFRGHMIIKHNAEVSDKEILDSKIQVTSWYKCKKCSLMVLNNLEDHNKRCSPETPYENSFDAIQVLKEDVPKLQCGVCPDSVESRIHLRTHLQEKHPELNNKVLLDPYYRCGVCLQLFTETSKLISHVNSCENSTPSLDTAQELAQKNLYCEICSKKHSKIRETLFCYQVKSLLRCVLCSYVSNSRTNFFNHLKIYHNRRTVGLCCPFCKDDIEKPTRQAFDHFIDDHYNVALKRAGEAALVRGRIQLQATAAANKLANSNNTNGNNNTLNARRIIRPILQPRKTMPVLRPKTTVLQQGGSAATPPGQQVTGALRPNLLATTVTSTATPGTAQTIRLPVNQVLRVAHPNLSVANVINANNYPPGTVFRPILIGNRTAVPQGYTVLPAQTIQTTANGNVVATAEPMDTANEDSILDISKIKAENPS